MSFTVKDTQPQVAGIIFDQYQSIAGNSSLPTGTQGPLEGQMWNDSVRKALCYYTSGQITTLAGSPLNGVISVANAVTAANPATPAKNLMAYTFPANSLNVANQAVNLHAQGEYTTASGQTPTLTIAVLLGGVSVLTWASAALTASTTNGPWFIDGTITTSTTGSSGTVFAHGTLNIVLGATTTAAATIYVDQNVAASSAINLTASAVLQVTALMSSSNASNSITEDLLTLSYT